MNFRVGQKVCCVKMGPWIDADTGEVAKDDRYPEYGKIYSISGIVSDDRTWLRLDGFRGLGRYNSTRFRPLVEKKTDISIFTNMLTDTEQKVTA